MKLSRRSGIISLVIGTIGFVALFKFNKEVIPLWNSNSINVTAEKPLKEEKVKI